MDDLQKFLYQGITFNLTFIDYDSQTLALQVLRTLDSLEHNTEEESVDAWLEVMGQLGLLAKRASMIACTMERLRMLTSWCERMEGLADEHYKLEAGDASWRKLLKKIGLASALAAFSLGWDEVEYSKIVVWLTSLEDAEITRNRRRVLRIFFWQFLDGDSTKASWLGYLLRTFTNVRSSSTKDFKSYQYAEFILCLFGPAQEVVSEELSSFKLEALTRLTGTPSYTALTKAFDGGYFEAKNIFADLGKALSTLLKSPIDSPCSSKRQLASIIDNMFAKFSWHIDNQAACLLFSCEKLVKVYLSYVIYQGKGMKRYAHLLAALVSVCGRMSNNLNQGLDKILHWAVRLPDYEEMELFVERFWAEFGARLREGSIPVDTIAQLGTFVTLEAVKVKNSKKAAFPENMEIEE